LIYQNLNKLYKINNKSYKIVFIK